ncbi:MAG: AMP-binding protein, partial [Rhodobacteraceae bacterium]|nr:AMP-binding protein [Paracoccaceae bacterium]MCB1408074.1 AMP-binding protein [Paracoccaceae bacterium]
MSYADVYRRSIESPDSFWLDQSRAIDWDTPPTQALFADNAPIYEWFKDAEVNTCWNAVDRHVAQGRGNQTAIIYDSPVTHTRQEITYAELLERVSSLAGALKAQGVEKGDRVIIYM